MFSNILNSITKTRIKASKLSKWIDHESIDYSVSLDRNLTWEDFASYLITYDLNEFRETEAFKTARDCVLKIKNDKIVRSKTYKTYLKNLTYLSNISKEKLVIIV